MSYFVHDADDVFFYYQRHDYYGIYLYLKLLSKFIRILRMTFCYTQLSLPVPPLFSIMFLDTLCTKKWYDMPHVGCGIHSLQ